MTPQRIPLLYRHSLILPSDDVQRRKTERFGYDPEEIVQRIALDDHLKNQTIKTDGYKNSVDQLVKRSNRCIYRISSSSFLNFFPTTITIEESKVTFTFRQFLSSQSHSVDLKDISNVFIESSLFSSTLQIVSRTYIQNDIKIENLNKKRAIKARRIIEGLRLLLDHNINTSEYEVDELIAKIEEMYASQGDS